MKFLNQFFLLFLFFFLSLASTQNLADNKVYYYNWMDFMPQGVLDAFSQETGIEVVYSTYRDGDVMLDHVEALNARAFDVVAGPTYAVQELANRGLLRAIDKKRIEQYIHIDKRLLNRSFDPENQFSIPFLSGTTSIIVDAEKVKNQISSWNDLWKPLLRDRIILPNDKRRVFYMALKALGYSGNTESLDEIKHAYQYLLKLVPNVKMVTNASDIDYTGNDVHLGLMWSGRAAKFRESRSSMSYIYPKEGAYIWIDNLFIPANAPNLDNAYTLINYLMRPEVAVKWLTEYNYPPSNNKVKTLVSSKVRNDPIIFPSDSLYDRLEYPLSVPKADYYYSLYWAKFIKLIKDRGAQGKSS